MSTVIEHKKYVCTDALNNNNKFWEYFLHDDGTVIVKYGRVGKTVNVDDPKPMTRAELDRKIREKTKGRGVEGTPSYKPPYREIAVVAEASVVNDTSTPSISKIVVKEAAISQLASGCSELSKLVERLVEANRHELYKASGGQMDIDLKTGIISTPLGVITKDTVAEARKMLNILDPFVQSRDFDSKTFIESLNAYLMLVPQTVGHSKGWHRNFFNKHNALVQQNTLLDQLESSADIAAARLIAAKDQSVKTDLSSTPSLFNAQLEILTDKDVIKMIEKKFFDTINTRHETRNMKPIRFYAVKMPDQSEAFDQNILIWDKQKKVDKNVWMLWHGTRMFNVLSILKSGLFCPPSGGSYHVTGRMFGDGIYGSDQSTKALNYAYGYWDGGIRDRNCFMFLVDFAMGKYHVPSGPARHFPAGYDSTFAKANMSGVMNNEMIVYKNNQVNIRYLVEFEEKR
jgi:poly [ADP-ribose] polymerase